MQECHWGNKKWACLLLLWEEAEVRTPEFTEFANTKGEGLGHPYISISMKCCFHIMQCSAGGEGWTHLSASKETLSAKDIPSAQPVTM